MFDMRRSTHACHCQQMESSVRLATLPGRYTTTATASINKNPTREAIIISLLMDIKERTRVNRIYI
jgi:hypothetical protein